jgi:hypothetical protein
VAALSNHGFRAATATDLSGPYPEDEALVISDYDYESDSDLDDEDFIEEAKQTAKTVPTLSTDCDETHEGAAATEDTKMSIGSGQVVVLKGTAFRT